MTPQQTVKYTVSITGYGLHTGIPTTIKISPASENTGILFFSSNGGYATPIQCTHSNIIECNLSTNLGNNDSSVSTIEHLMSALHAMSIDNALITISGSNEVPILDGSASGWYTLLKSAGVQQLNISRQYIEVDKEIKVVDGDKWVSIRPYDGLVIECTIVFDHPAIKTQTILWCMDEDDYYHGVSMARTFGFKSELKKLKKMGYLKGGDENTAIILGRKRVVNGSLRYENEFVRHKLLDLIGDIYVNGPIKGFIKSYCSGHCLNSKFIGEVYEYYKKIST